MREVLSMRIIAVLLLALALVACGGNTVQVGEDFYVGEDVRARVVDARISEGGYVFVEIETENVSRDAPENRNIAACRLIDNQQREFRPERDPCMQVSNPNVVQTKVTRFTVAPDAEDFTLEIHPYSDPDEPIIAVLPLD
jgi:predicted small secreted protein